MKSSKLGPAIVFLAIGISTFTARIACADPEAKTEAGSHFGGEVALADLASIGLVVAGGVLGGKTHSAVVGSGLAVPGAIGYLAGSAAIHLGHDDAPGAWRAGIVRIAAPAVGAAAIYLLTTGDANQEDECNGCIRALKVSLGAGAGMLAAMIFDWATAVEPARNPSPSAVTIVPVITVGGTTGAGLWMRF